MRQSSGLAAETQGIGADLPSSRADRASTGGASLITIYRHMLGRLTVATAAIMSVIVIEQVLHKSPQLYYLVMGGALFPARSCSIWLHILPVIFYHATPEIVSIAVACRYYQWIENNEVLSLRSAGRSSCQIACPGSSSQCLPRRFARSIRCACSR